MFELFGKFVAIALLNGCPGPHFITPMGYTKATLTFKDKNDLLNACIKHIVLSSVAEEIYSFRKGLASFGALDLLHKFQDDDVKKLMYVEISVDDVKSCFVPCFSRTGTELHEKETEMVYKWHSFLPNVKKGNLNVMYSPFLKLPCLVLVVQNSKFLH